MYTKRVSLQLIHEGLAALPVAAAVPGDGGWVAEQGPPEDSGVHKRVAFLPAGSAGGWREARLQGFRNPAWVFLEPYLASYLALWPSLLRFNHAPCGL